MNPFGLLYAGHVCRGQRGAAVMFNQVLTLVKELGRKCLAWRTGPESSAEILIGTSQIPIV